MKKMTRLDLIVKGKNLVSALLGIKTRKINRAVSSAIDTAEENAISSNENVNKLLSKLGEVYDNPAELTNAINSICEEMDKAELWAKRAEQVKKIAELLKEEVEVEEE